MTDKENQTGAAEKPEKKSGGSLGSKLMIVGFMSIVVLVEVVAAYCLIPSADQVAQLAKDKMAKELPAVLAGSEEQKKEKNPVMEIDLGQYSVTASQSDSSVALRIDFHLYGTVVENDASETTSLFERNTHRFRDQVLYEIRNADLTDLNDPGLGLIKRRILEKSNALFGKPVLRAVVFSDFSFIEQ